MYYVSTTDKAYIYLVDTKRPRLREKTRPVFIYLCALVDAFLFLSPPTSAATLSSMANKRRVSPNEDSDEDSSAEKSPSTKRARVAGGDETQRIKNAKRGKRKANTGDDDEEAEEFDRVDVSHIIADNDEPYSPTKGSSQSRSKRTGVRASRVLQNYTLMPRTLYRVYVPWVSLSQSKCTILCAIPVFPSNLVRRSTS